MEKNREIWVDWMRITACFLVMVVHSAEPYYLGGYGPMILSRADLFWVSLLDSFGRMSVPMFVLASSYLQFPLQYPTREFFKRRARRILIPFVIWTLIYLFVKGDPRTDALGLAFNFSFSAGHLWFIYMLVGLYLLMPLLSPWAEKVSRKELKAYIGIWLFTTIIPYLRILLGDGGLSVTMGPGGIPNEALLPLWGECCWNHNGTFYYLSGIAGYMLLGLYFRRFAAIGSWRKTLCTALPLLIFGMALVQGGFLLTASKLSGGVFPISGEASDTVLLEQSLYNDTLGVALMTIGMIVLMRKITAGGSFYKKIVLPVSKASYGMYLAHMLVLSVVCEWFRNVLGLGEDGILGFWTCGAGILGSAIVSYLIVAVLAVAVQHIPKVGKYIMG